MAEPSYSRVPPTRTYKILISVGVVLVLLFMTVGLVLAHMANAPTAGDEAGGNRLAVLRAGRAVTAGVCAGPDLALDQ